VQTYTISGTVSGLAAGASLGLKNDGTDAISLNTNGVFSFTNAVDSGGSYNVWVSQEPLNPVQFCVLKNGKGTATSNVTNIQVVCTTPAGQTLYNFGQQPDGIAPTGAPVFDNLGNLYGVTTYGGTSGEGTVFMLTPGKGQWTETAIYTFCPIPGCADGSEPGAGLIWDAAGNLYGTTNRGGAYGGGTVFKLSKNGTGIWTETVLHSFGNGTDGIGSDGISGLVFDSSGNLYGTTVAGGSAGLCGGLNCGTAFELSPGPGGTWTESVIYNFCSAAGLFCPDGAYPMGELALDAAGNLFGTTYQGGGIQGAGGTVFELSPHEGGQWIGTVLHVFGLGEDAEAGVILDTAGNLYGTTAGGGGGGYCTGCGGVFELTSLTGGQWQETEIYSFSGTDGSSPSAPLVFDKAGNLYGTTTGGGPGYAGVVFALTPSEANQSWAEVPLYGFGYIKNGAGNVSGLAMDAQGNLYGVGAALGTDGNGMVFSVTP
jgi:uncharacterized repeat protein (TIGR03803 family)